MTNTEIDSLVARYLHASLDAAEIGLTLEESVESLEAQQFNRYATVRDDTLHLLGTGAVDLESAEWTSSQKRRKRIACEFSVGTHQCSSRRDANLTRGQ